MQTQRHSSWAARVPIGFMAGFTATLIFHQPGLTALHAAGMTPVMPYAL